HDETLRRRVLRITRREGEMRGSIGGIGPQNGEVAWLHDLNAVLLVHDEFERSLSRRDADVVASTKLVEVSEGSAVRRAVAGDARVANVARKRGSGVMPRAFPKIGDTDTLDDELVDADLGDHEMGDGRAVARRRSRRRRCGRRRRGRAYRR